ncbi:MAG: phage portal protein [Proteobacteria bacterium]|nr:MAG: phage portal protein [Pseudomonadota bacterium]
MKLKFWKKDPPPVRIEPKLDETEPVTQSRGKMAPTIKQRNYDSTVMSRITADWTAAPAHIDQIIFNNLRVLVARSRDRFINDDYGKRFVSLVKANVVGPNGFGLESRAVGNDEKPDQAATVAIEKAWKSYKKKTNCDVTGRHSFTELNQLIIGTIVVDGEALIRYHRSGHYGQQLELIDPQKLDVNYNDTLEDGRYIRFGIEYNARGRVLAYHLSQPSGIANIYLASYNTRNYERVPAGEMDHLFIPIFAEQKRGIPWMATSLVRMKMLGGFEDASLVAARAGASKMGFFTVPAGDDYQPGEKDETGAVISEFEPGTFEELPEGVQMQSFDPQYPAGEFDMFMKSCLRGIASGFGVDYVSLANNLEGVNYSSLRHGELLNRELWKAMQQWLIENWLNDFMERWIIEQYQRSTITIKGRPLSRKLQNYLPHRWQGRRWEWVDPLKDMNAKLIEYKMGVTSISQIIRERGRDPEEIWREREKEDKRMKELGIEPGQMLGFVVSEGEKNAE